MKNSSKACLMLLLAGFILTVLPAEAQANGQISQFFIGRSYYVADGQKTTMDAVPFINNERTYIPIRYLADVMGCTVNWDGSAHKATLTRGNDKLELVIGDKALYINGSAQNMDVPPLEAGGRTYLPAGYIAPAFGYSASWDAVNQAVTIAPGSGLQQVAEFAGPLTKDQTWSGEVYISGTVEVPAGITLTIEPGTVIKFRHYRGYKEPEKRCGMEVMGTLKAVGTPEKQIRFTSDAADPVNGDWHMLRLVNAGSESIIKYAVVEFAQQGINLWNCSPTISHTVVRWNNWEGIYLESYCKALIEYNLIYENGYNGIAMEQFNDATVRYNTIMRSGTHGIHVDASTVRAQDNILKENKASGLSVDDHGTIIATDNSIENNGGPDITIGEGANTVIAQGNLFKNNADGINSSPGNKVENIPGNGAGTLAYDFQAPSGHQLGYIPGDPAQDRYRYVYPDDETRQITKKIGEGLGLTWSIAWDGQYIWTAALWGDVYQLDPVSGAIKTHWLYPGPQAWGMTYDGEHLWINDFAEKKIYELSTDGKVLSSFPCPDQAGGAKGITWDGESLCIMGWTSPKIYKVDKQGNLLETIQIQGGYAGGGLAWDGNYFWAPGGKGIAKIDRQGRIVGGIYAASEGTWDLTWDGNYLWACQRTNESWQDAKVFQLKITNDGQ